MYELPGDSPFTPKEFAVSWLASRPTVTSVIVGPTSPEQVPANVTAAGWKSTDAELAEVDAILTKSGHRSGYHRKRQAVIQREASLRIVENDTRPMPLS